MNNQPLPPGLDNIKHIVVLMFENRSFDHLFGDFTNVNGLVDQNGKIKEECYNLMDPLKSPDPPPPLGKGTNPKIYPAPGDPCQPLPHDYTHDFGDGMMPDLFGPIFSITGVNPYVVSNPLAIYNSGCVNGKAYATVPPPTPLPATYPATNSGFVSTYNSNKPQGPSVMTYYRKGTLPVLHTLAEEFVLCDNWHCDMPGHTKANRCFMHCSTTGNLGIDDTDGGIDVAPNVFDLITSQSLLLKGLTPSPTWKMYAAGNEADRSGELDTRFLDIKLLTENETNECGQYKGYSLTDFADDCTKGTLPYYSFLMSWLQGPYSKYTDTSMHPASTMIGGENLLAAVYNTIRSNPERWHDTLLVVNFDENGGIYDHVFPPTTTPPDPGAAPITSSDHGDCGNFWLQKHTFDFSLLGPRIPALLISPWLAKGIDSTQYQNTSLLRFIIDRMNAIYGTEAQPLTQRDATAPSLYSAFTRFGQTAIRTDCPQFMAPWTSLPVEDPGSHSTAVPYSDGTLSTWVPPTGSDAASPASYINEYLNIYISPLKGHPDSGKKITREFATNADVSQYIKERDAAAVAYYNTTKKK